MFQTLWKPIKCWIQMHHVHHHVVRQSQWCSQSLCNKNRGLCDKSGSRFRSKESQSNAKLLSNSNNEAHCSCRHTQIFCRHVKETTSNTDAPTNTWRVNPMFKLPRTSKGAKFVSLMSCMKASWDQKQRLHCSLFSKELHWINSGNLLHDSSSLQVSMLAQCTFSWSIVWSHFLCLAWFEETVVVIAQQPTLESWNDSSKQCSFSHSLWIKIATTCCSKWHLHCCVVLFDAFWN